MSSQQVIELSEEYYKRGNELKELGRQEEAILDYTKAIELNPKYHQVYYNRGIILDDLGRKEEAIVDFTKVIELNPQYDKAYYNRGIILKDLGRKEEAILDYTKAIELNQKFYEAYFERGQNLLFIILGILFYVLGRNEQAIVDFTKVIELNPKYHQVYYGRGHILNHLGRNEEAILDFTKAIELNPKYDIAYYGRGQNLLFIILANKLNDLGRKEEAIIDYTKAIELNPKYHQAYYNRGQNLLFIILGIILRDFGRKQEAITNYLQALKLTPDNPLYLCAIGDFYYQENEKIKAKNYFSKAEQELMQINEAKKRNDNLSEVKEEIEKTQQQIKSNQLPPEEKNKFEILLNEIQSQANHEVGQSNTENTSLKGMELILAELLKIQGRLRKHSLQIGEVKQEQILQNQDLNEIKSQDQIVIQKELNLLKNNKSKFLYYRSLSWKLQSYLFACNQLSTDLFMANNDAVIETTKQQFSQYAIKIGADVADTLAIPQLSSVLDVMNTALECYKKRKFRERVQRLANVSKMKTAGQSELEREIQFGVISLAKQLPEDLNTKSGKNIFEYIESIFEIDYNNGIKEAKSPYWIQGIADSILILHYLEENSGAIQDDSVIKLRDIIVKAVKQNNAIEGLKQYPLQIENEKDKEEDCCCLVQ